MEKNLMTPDSLINVRLGKAITFAPLETVKSANALRGKPALLMNLATVIGKAASIQQIANAIPKKYSPARILAWQQSYDFFLMK